MSIGATAQEPVVSPSDCQAHPEPVSNSDRCGKKYIDIAHTHNRFSIKRRDRQTSCCLAATPLLFGTEVQGLCPEMSVDIAPDSEFATAVYQWVASVPEGKVASYGRIARLAGFPRHARFVGKQWQLGFPLVGLGMVLCFHCHYLFPKLLLVFRTMCLSSYLCCHK